MALKHDGPGARELSFRRGIMAALQTIPQTLHTQVLHDMHVQHCWVNRATLQTFLTPAMLCCRDEHVPHLAVGYHIQARADLQQSTIWCSTRLGVTTSVRKRELMAGGDPLLALTLCRVRTAATFTLPYCQHHHTSSMM